MKNDPLGGHLKSIRRMPRSSVKSDSMASCRAVAKSVRRDTAPSTPFSNADMTVMGSRHTISSSPSNRSALKSAPRVEVLRKDQGRFLFRIDGPSAVGDEVAARIVDRNGDPATMTRMMALTEEVTNGRGMSYMLFATCPAFGNYFKPPGVLDHLLSDPCSAVGAIHSALIRCQNDLVTGRAEGRVALQKLISQVIALYSTDAFER